MGIQESLKRQNNWGNSLMSSSPPPPSLGEKKTGSRRRNVIKEDLVAEEQKTSGEFTHVQTTGNTYYFNIRASTLHTHKFFKQMSILKQLQPAAGELLFWARHAWSHTHNLCGTFVPPFPYYSSKMREIEGPQHTSTTSQWQLAINPFCLDDRSAETHKNILNFLQLLACSFSLMLVQWRQ